MDYGYDTNAYGTPIFNNGGPDTGEDHTYGTKCNCPRCASVRAYDAQFAEENERALIARIKQYREYKANGVERDVSAWEGLGVDYITIEDILRDKNYRPIPLNTEFLDSIYKL